MRSRSDDIAAYFAEHASRLERLVRARVTASRATVEDACAYAWLQLVRRDDVSLDDSAAGWLYRVAVHEAWRLAALDRATVSYASRADDDDQLGGNVPEPAAAQTVHELVADRIELAALGKLRPRERRALLLLAFGYTYAEIAELTGDSIRTVDRLLRRAKQQARGCGPAPKPGTEPRSSAERSDGRRVPAARERCPTRIPAAG